MLYEHAIQVDPKYVKAYVQLARLLLTEGKSQEDAGCERRRPSSSTHLNIQASTSTMQWRI